MKTLGDLKAKRRKLVKKIKKTDRKIADLLSQTVVVCGECGYGHEIVTLTYIQTHWYTRPRGCTGGDYWSPGEGQWTCPTCDARNRLYKLPEIEALKDHFLCVVDEHED
jgi:rubrerythrin